MRHPALSPDGKWVAFSYHGDIWRVAAVGGRAERLTVHPGRDQRPIWSPDGSRLAFASDREGQEDIFVINAGGGPARRVTFATSTEYPCDWSPDGRFILIERSATWRPDLYEVPVSGGPARQVTAVPEEGEYFARYRDDGKEILFCDGRGYINWWLEGNKSSRAGQIWTLKRNSWPPEVKRVTPEGTQFLWPGYAAGDIVATSNQTRVPNVVRMKRDGSETRMLTNFADDGVKWLRTSRDGSRAVFEQGMKLWQIDLATDSVREIVVEAPSDWIESPRIPGTIDGKIEEFTLAPDGRRIAFAAAGELYLIPSEKPEKARRLTATDARERFPVFSPDGKQLVYCSDRNGRQNLYTIDTRSGVETALTAFDDLDVSRPQYAPDGSAIVFYLSNDRIARIAPEGGKVDTLLIGRYFDFPLETTQEFRFSPDSRYLAYTAFGRDYNTDIWIHALDGSANINVTRWSQYNFDPHWSPDGKYLSFVHSVRGSRDLYAVRLEKTPPEFAEARLDSLYEAAPAETESPGQPVVRIDFDDIERRWQGVMPMAASQEGLIQTPDGKYWLFVADLPGGRQIWKAPVDSRSGEKPAQLTSGGGAKSQLAVSPDSKTVYYLDGGRIGSVGIDGTGATTLSFAADYDYHTAARNAQKLTEVWRILGNYFYDPELHGAAWDNLRRKYAEALPHIALTSELEDLLKEFIGGLNASHLDIYGGTPSLPAARQSGYLGVEFDPDALRQGVYRIAAVYAEGPVDLPGGEATPGDTIIRVGDVALNTTADIDSLMAGKIGDRVFVTLQGTGGERTIAVKPVSKTDNATLRYENWVAGRRRMVDSLSSGRLGYLHIRAMNQPALDRFKREIVAATADHEGLVVDVRYNGGGWIAVHLLGMLERQPYVLRNFRGGGTVSENKSRSYAVEKPMILLINHYSASNSEIFAEGWRKLGLGMIVGYPTAGAVIGTSEYPLIDGSHCRRPSWGAYTVDMENLEGNGRRPDIELFNTQTDWGSGRDPQLERAVEELITELR